MDKKPMQLVSVKVVGFSFKLSEEFKALPWAKKLRWLKDAKGDFRAAICHHLCFLDLPPIP